ncbi:DUF1329 domain-containing protein [Pseudomonas fluorescens]|uniref:DUF1329 domain-containing protein n=1 Tax=Pseudomonas fluorescens TaxID=294 RepID=A0A5E7AKN6_PSEFL|nr:DUF1329 domain-containing protein [Pseudomonas fluorescens]VVN79055.1 hypothetical protein PS704_00948 [Pseudomonas fluorescens]
MQAKETILCAAMWGFVLSTSHVLAAVTPEEAAKLKTTLTPMGAERAGNKDGSIPAWEGGYTTVPAGYKNGESRPDPFANEKPLFSITSKNMDSYGEKLTDGIKAMLKKYPDSYRLDVYPTHRTAAAPQWVYDNTFVNATRAKMVEGNVWIEGAYGGTPFPIPKSGAEAMWNHKLAWVGEATSFAFNNYVGTPDGKLVLSVRGYNKALFPYYNKNGSLETFKGQTELLRVWMTDPPVKSGEQFALVDSINKPRQAWQYLPGQRRVRKAPTLGYDTPSDINSGMEYYDESYIFLGDLDRYDWKLVGKKEIYIPYNNNKFLQKDVSIEKQLLPHHINPDSTRWELHRVWVVEADLAPGKRHVVPKRRYYLDEDTWGAILADGWDGQGQLWRTQIALPFLIPDGPFVYPNLQWSTHNLQTGGWSGVGATNWSNPSYTFHLKMLSDAKSADFTPEAMSGEGVR